MKKNLIRTSILVAVFTALITSCSMMKTNKGAIAHTPVEEAYYKWVKEVEVSDGNTKEILDLYANNAILLPTLSPKILTTKSMLNAYFRSFLALENIKVKTNRLISRQYADIAMNTGLYSFTYTEKGRNKTLHCRFDFWYKKIDGEWKIIFHQSSVLPDGKM